MADPRKATAREARTLLALSNAELGEIWCRVVRDYAHKRTGSSRDFWRKLLDEPDVIAIHAEFKRRALRRAEDYDAYVQMTEL
jgi:hypothetical protein